MELSHKRAVRQRSWAQSGVCWAHSDQMMMLHAALVHKLPCEAISCAFAWSCRAKAALQNYFLSFCMELLLKTCSAKLFLELSHGSVVQKLPFEAVF